MQIRVVARCCLELFEASSSAAIGGHCDGTTHGWVSTHCAPDRAAAFPLFSKAEHVTIPDGVTQGFRQDCEMGGGISALSELMAWKCCLRACVCVVQPVCKANEVGSPHTRHLGLLLQRPPAL